VLGAIAEGERQGLFEEARILAEVYIRVPPDMAHLPFSVLGAFKNAEVLGQDFDGGASMIAFHLPPEDRAAFEQAWRERSRGGAVEWR
jgi:hypothetical protein